MNHKKFYTLSEIASILNSIERIDSFIKSIKNNYNSELSKKLIAYYENKRKNLSWVFDLDVDPLIAANKLRRGDRIINGKEKVYMNI